MQENRNERQRNATSEELQAVLDCLSFTQKLFVIARQETTTDKAAAEKIGIRPHLPYEWKSRGFPINDALRLMAQDSVAVALDLRRKALARAMAVKVAGLESDDEGTRQRCASELIEWELGKAGATLDVDLGGEFKVDHVSTDADLVADAKEVIASLAEFQV